MIEIHSDLLICGSSGNEYLGNSRKKYMLIGENKNETSDFFTGERIKSLSETTYWMIEAGGNMFTFDRFEIGERGERIRIDAPLEKGRIDDALNALKIFTAPVR